VIYLVIANNINSTMGIPLLNKGYEIIHSNMASKETKRASGGG